MSGSRTGEPLLSFDAVVKRYPGKPQPALAGVSFQLRQGECLGLAGPSGCGKSTIARLALNLIAPDEGAVRVAGRNLDGLDRQGRRALYRDIQMVMQNPADSFDPLRTLESSLVEFGRLAGLARPAAKERAAQLFEQVGLDPQLLFRRPHQASGGQLQRAAFARALMANPRVLVCDETTSALDVVAQEGVIELIRSLKDRCGILFISHDLAVAATLCDRLAVMSGGAIVETGPTRRVIDDPQHPCTRLMIESVLEPD